MAYNDVSIFLYTKEKMKKCCCCHTPLKPMGNKNGYHLVECPACGFITTYPLPSFAKIKAVYSREYFVKEPDSQKQFGYENVFSPGFQRGNIRWARTRLQIINSILGKCGKILDVGCASGIFLEVARDMGWSTSGVEINHEMREIAVKACSTGTVATSIADITESYEVITMWEYLEHVTQPEEALENVRRLLKPQGLLCLSFPNIESRKGCQDKLDWEHVKPPEHLHYWTDGNIRLLLKRFGFSDIVFRYFGPRWYIEGIRKWGSRSNPKTLLWPAMSIATILFGRFYATSVKAEFSARIRSWFEGIEVYAQYKGEGHV